jgi:DMSO/TMAO reductase YedYZ molybdopterin-dependent catalytic subunit
MEKIISPDLKRENRIPPGQRRIEKWPVLHYGDISYIDTDSWTFSITGRVKKEKIIAYEEFMGLPRIEVVSDIHCVTGWSRLDNVWEGVSTGVLKDLVDIENDVRFVIVHAAQGFTTNLTLEDFFEEDVLFACNHDGEPLSPEHGGPVRLVVPRLYFWKSAKWVTGVEFTRSDRKGFWETMGYHTRGDPWKEERYESGGFSS